MAELFWDKIKGLLGFEDQNEPTKPYQPEIKPVKPEGFFQESFARAGEMLQGQQISRPTSLFDVGYNIAKSNIQSIPQGISNEGIINKDVYVPVVSEAGYIGRKIAGLLEPTGQALEDVGHGGDVIRFGEQTRIPTVTKTGQELGLLGMDIATMGGAKPARTIAKDVYRGTMDWLAEPPPSEAFQLGAVQDAYMGVKGTDPVTSIRTDMGELSTKGTGAWATKLRGQAYTYAPQGNVVPVRIEDEGFASVNFAGENWKKAPQGAQLQIPGREAIDVSGMDTNAIARIAREQGAPGLRFQNIWDEGPYGAMNMKIPGVESDINQMRRGGTEQFVVFDKERIWPQAQEGLLGRPAVGASGKPTGAIEYSVTPEANQIIAAERQAARVGPRQPAQPPAFIDPRFKAPVDPETGMYSPVEEALLNLRQETMTPQQARSYLMNQGLSRGQLEDSGVWDDLQWAQNNNERVTKTGLLDTLGTDMPQQEIQVRRFEQGSQQPSEFDFSNPEVIDDYAYIESVAEDLAYDAFSLDQAGSTWYRDQRMRIAENYTGDPELVQSIFDELEAAAGGFGNARLQDLSRDAEEAVSKWADEIATEQYYENPVVRYDIDVSGDGDYYTVVGNEDFGFSLEDARGRPFGDTVYSLNEAEVQIRAHATDEGYGLADVGNTKWSDYTMGGLDPDDLEDMNYEEILIKAPPIRGGRDYVPNRMHWDEEENVVYHIRKTDRMGEGGQDILFIEELQSDWHQKGRQKGYDKFTDAERREKIVEIHRAYGRSNEEIRKAEEALKAADENPASNPRLSAAINQIADMHQTPSSRGMSNWDIARNIVHNAISWDNSTGNEAVMKIIQDTPELSALYKGRLNERAARRMDNEFNSMIPQGLFADDRWISQGLKQMLVKAAKEGKDGVAWTPSHIQVGQWSNRYRKLYETLYDKKLPGIAKKLEKEYGVKFEKIKIDGEEVPYLRLNKKARERIRERGMELSAVAPGIPGAGLLADQQDNEQNQPMRGLLG